MYPFHVSRSRRSSTASASSFVQGRRSPLDLRLWNWFKVVDPKRPFDSRLPTSTTRFERRDRVTRRYRGDNTSTKLCSISDLARFRGASRCVFAVGARVYTGGGRSDGGVVVITIVVVDGRAYRGRFTRILRGATARSLDARKNVRNGCDRSFDDG